jgi:hypothetical protein
MRSGHRLRSKDRVFWTIRCKICGTDRISRSGGTFLHLTPRSTLYCGYVSFHPHPLCSNPSSQIPFTRGAAKRRWRRSPSCTNPSPSCAGVYRGGKRHSFPLSLFRVLAMESYRRWLQLVKPTWNGATTSPFEYYRPQLLAKVQYVCKY